MLGDVRTAWFLFSFLLKCNVLFSLSLQLGGSVPDWFFLNILRQAESSCECRAVDWFSSPEQRKACLSKQVVWPRVAMKHLSLRNQHPCCLCCREFLWINSSLVLWVECPLMFGTHYMHSWRTSGFISKWVNSDAPRQQFHALLPWIKNQNQN